MIIRKKMNNLKCPDCNSEMVLKQTKKFTYKDGSPRKFYSCVRFPECNGIISCHQDGKPYGTPVTKKTRQLRIQAHTAFDSLWKQAGMERRDAYKWLSQKMGIKASQCHIGMFDEFRCLQVIEIMIEWQKQHNLQVFNPFSEIVK